MGSPPKRRRSRWRPTPTGGGSRRADRHGFGAGACAARRTGSRRRCSTRSGRWPTGRARSSGWRRSRALVLRSAWLEGDIDARRSGDRCGAGARARVARRHGPWRTSCWWRGRPVRDGGRDADWWREHGCPLRGRAGACRAEDPAALRQSLEELQAMGAAPAAAIVARRLRVLGERGLPRGPRRRPARIRRA